MAETPKSTRRLRPHEPVPTEPPTISKLTTDGYWEYFWKTGTATYVRALAHRCIGGRYTDAEVIHHINENKLDNRPENLQPMTRSEHAHHHLVPDFEWEDAMARYEAGENTTVIGASMGVHPATLSRGFRKRGLTMRHPTPNKRDDITEIVLRRHREGLRPGAIGKELGLSRSPVDRILREHGIPPYRPGRP